MREDANRAVLAAIEQAIERGEVGLQVAAYLGDELVVDAWSGLAKPESGELVRGDTLFNVFSVTKGVTATAVHLQAERGLVDYDALLMKYWPEFGQQGKHRLTVRDGLMHRTCIPQMPEGVTPELMCDWEWMTTQLPAAKPLYPPGTKSPYHGYTWGWVNAMVVERTDPKQRPFCQFVREEIFAPLAVDEFYIGIPDGVEDRIATLIDAPTAGRPAPAPGAPVSIPANVGTVRAVYERDDVRRACLPGMGAITNARSVARFWALHANRGAFNGARLLSEERVLSLATPRPPVAGDELDAGNISIGGYWIDAPRGASTMASKELIGHGPHVISHPGAGMSIGWADPDTGLSAAICHNRMFSVQNVADDPLIPVAKALRAALNLGE